MKPFSYSSILYFVLAVLLLSGCTASEQAARQARKEQFYAERQQRKSGNRQIVPRATGQDARLAKQAEKAERKKKRKELRAGKTEEPAHNARITGTRPNTNKDIRKVIGTARSYIGTPYRDAGTTRIGMDCSGLIVTCFQSIDMKLPRNSRDQSNFGRPVDLKQLREGDLVFFGPSKNSKQITHVGMVTEVKSDQEITFIHSSTSLGVVENNLYSRYYIDRFVKASRPF